MDTYIPSGPNIISVDSDEENGPRRFIVGAKATEKPIGA